MVTPLGWKVWWVAEGAEHRVARELAACSTHDSRLTTRGGALNWIRGVGKTLISQLGVPPTSLKPEPDRTCRETV